MEFLRSLKKILGHPENKGHKLKTLLRLAWWKVNQIFFHLPSVVELAPGIKCICYPESSFGSQIIYTKLPEYSEMKFVLKVLRPSDIFVDVGAGIGDYSLLAASIIKKGKIVAFEPDPVALRYFRENIALNGVQQLIELSNKIISDKNGYENFTSEKISELSHISYADFDKRAGSNKTPSIMLDSYFKHTKKRIKLIKIDVEGAELKVLRGLNGLLKKKAIDYMIIEINHNSSLYANGKDKVFSLLKKYGYGSYYFTGDNKVRPLKDITVLDGKVFNILAALKKPD